MTAHLLDGNALSQKLRGALQEKTAHLLTKGIHPGLAVILAGDDPASEVYVQHKVSACEALGIYSEKHRFSSAVSEKELLDCVAALNRNPLIHGVLVQLPLPRHIHADTILKAVAAHKDVDGFLPENLGNLSQGTPTVIACTPYGVMKFLEDAKIDVAGKEAVVIGRSNIVGKPMAMLLTNAGATVTVCHSKTRDLLFHTKRADILVAAIGKPRMVTGDMVKSGAVVIDVGINRTSEGKLCGDVDFESVVKVASYLTPVPGGVGPMTITMLLWNTLAAAEKVGSSQGKP